MKERRISWKELDKIGGVKLGTSAAGGNGQTHELQNIKGENRQKNMWENELEDEELEIQVRTATQDMVIMSWTIML